MPGVYSDSKDIVDRLMSVDQWPVIDFRSANKLDHSVSACANVYAAVRLSTEIEKGTIVTIIPESGVHHESS